MYTYCTTMGQITPLDAAGQLSSPERADAEKSLADNPKPPPSEGWELCGTAASGVLLFWTWRRPCPLPRQG
jgi:hypothetical protein